MKNITIFLIFWLLSLSSYAERPYLISGFDDVLRQAENTGLFRAALKILEPDKTFTGMPELYKTLTTEEPEPKFVLVSAISQWFDSRIGKFLNETDYPVHQRYLRNWITQWSIEDFKVNTIKKIIAGRKNRRFIIIFDNSDASINLAEKLHEIFPAQIQAIYLREVVKKPVPKGATSFYTSFDIALNEFEAGRMSPEEVKQIANVLIHETEMEMLFPSYAICPSQYDPCPRTTGELSQACDQVRSHVRKICRSK